MMDDDDYDYDNGLGKYISKIKFSKIIPTKMLLIDYCTCRGRRPEQIAGVHHRSGTYESKC